MSACLKQQAAAYATVMLLCLRFILSVWGVWGSHCRPRAAVSEVHEWQWGVIRAACLRFALSAWRRCVWGSWVTTRRGQSRVSEVHEWQRGVVRAVCLRFMSDNEVWSELCVWGSWVTKRCGQSCVFEVHEWQRGVVRAVCLRFMSDNEVWSELCVWGSWVTTRRGQSRVFEVHEWQRGVVRAACLRFMSDNEAWSEPCVWGSWVTTRRGQSRVFEVRIVGLAPLCLRFMSDNEAWSEPRVWGSWVTTRRGQSRVSEVHEWQRGMVRAVCLRFTLLASRRCVWGSWVTTRRGRSCVSSTSRNRTCRKRLSAWRSWSCQTLVATSTTRSTQRSVSLINFTCGLIIFIILWGVALYRIGPTYDRFWITSIWLIVHFCQPMKVTYVILGWSYVGPILPLVQRPSEVWTVSAEGFVGSLSTFARVADVRTRLRLSADKVHAERLAGGHDSGAQVLRAGGEAQPSQHASSLRPLHGATSSRLVASLD